MQKIGFMKWEKLWNELIVGIEKRDFKPPNLIKVLGFTFQIEIVRYVRFQQNVLGEGSEVRYQHICNNIILFVSFNVFNFI